MRSARILRISESAGTGEPTGACALNATVRNNSMPVAETKTLGEVIVLLGSQLQS
jgi:hypothetical protein